MNLEYFYSLGWHVPFIFLYSLHYSVLYYGFRCNITLVSTFWLMKCFMLTEISKKKCWWILLHYIDFLVAYSAHHAHAFKLNLNYNCLGSCVVELWVFQDTTRCLMLECPTLLQRYLLGFSYLWLCLYSSLTYDKSSYQAFFKYIHSLTYFYHIYSKFSIYFL